MDLTHVVQTMGAAVQDDGPGLPGRLCTAFSHATEGRGAALALMADPTHHHTLCASDAYAAALCELEFDLGVGPGLEAFKCGHPVLIGDLHGADGQRWPIWSAAIQAKGFPARAVFGFPLHIAGTAFGLIQLYRDRPGTLDRSDVAAAALAADLAALALARSFDHPTPGTLPEWFPGPALDGVEVDQAIGMVMAQLRAPAETALATLRARAFTEDRPLDAVAGDVLTRRIVFGPGGEEKA
ncbi:GAF and ANTAR domain-containing protein [Kitasatospora sp. MBT63]|uniref:GAF and ANTAR domain-containing protein n=1 Tax=Kitasatospora sp. MBT63 TaxID=1444768 RepID=UPI00069175A6|nr:GAF and ANTAR domain-containing protein [Kitasatospora sp. MBT63]